MTESGLDISDNARFESLGFKCGIEIHQQLNTEKKLFCHCPVGLTKRRHDAEILRHMRPTLSELGEYDGTALMEFKTKKNVIYRLYRDRTCTYEMDDTPPFLVNQQAIDYAIRISLLFNCRIVDEIHVIRKQYLDGSIPTGFQRTMIIGIDGRVPFRGRDIKINQVNLEEEACREVTDIGHDITFATDRLSIPLVEIITDCQMKNPEEAMEVCRLLGNAMKITGLVRRGIGTVRQDVNVSVTGGHRVEIKGVHKVGNIRPLTAIEAVRQKKLLELKDIFINRHGLAENIKYRENGFTSLFSGSNNMIGRYLESDRPFKVGGLLLPQMSDIVTCGLQPDWDFGSELSGRVRVIACIDCKPNLFFLSHREQYDIPETLWDKIKEQLNWREGDDIVVICGPSDDVTTAFNEIKIRIAELADGVIHETRQDMKNGTTDFERILPGPDRMYPDTDHPPVKITPERVEKNRQLVTEPLWEKQNRWQKLGLHQEQIKALSLSPFADLFDSLTEDSGDKIKKAAHIFTGLLTGLRRENIDLAKTDRDVLKRIISQSLTQDWPVARLKKALSGLTAGDATEQSENKVITNSEFNDIWQRVSAEFNGNRSNNKEKFRRFITGRILAKYPEQTHRVLSLIEEKLS